MLFDKKTKKAFKVIWIVLGVLIMISMVLLYTPIFTAPSSPPPPPTSL